MVPSPTGAKLREGEGREEAIGLPYVKRTVRAGLTIETRKMFAPRVGGKNQCHRGPVLKDTEEAQMKVNERKAEERLRWKMNANFGKNDLHAVLHYNDKPQDLFQIMDDKERFFRILRKKCKEAVVVLKYIAMTETKRMTNPHHHILMGDMDVHIIAEAWTETVGLNGSISFRPLDGRGNHAKLAAYFIKESRSTMKRLKEAKKYKKRFSCSKGLVQPTAEYKIVPSESWRKEAKPRKGYHLYEFDDGSTQTTGFHEVSGYAFQEYWEVRNDPPKERRRPHEQGAA